MILLTPVSCPLDATGDGIIDENDVMYILRRVDQNNYPTPCPPAMICAADVNFDCHIDRDDSAAVLEAIKSCHPRPCPCGEEGSSMAGFAGGAGLSVEAFADALMAQDPMHHARRIAPYMGLPPDLEYWGLLFGGRDARLDG